MRPTLSLSRKVFRRTLRQLVTFRFPFFNGTVFTDSFQVRGAVNRGQIIVTQSRAPGTITNPIIRYQIVNAATGRPVTNSVTVIGVRTVSLPFVLPAGTFRLSITNAGAGAAAVQGVIVVF